jgi:preprotein translocase subunit SecB
MSENETQDQEREFVIQRIYIKDLSFESPNAPEVFRGEWTPQNELSLNTQVNRLDDQNFEVVLSITVTAKLGDKTAFIAEVHQAGVFTLGGFSDQELAPLVGAYCPNILFPYAREALTDVVTKGSFPQLVLQPINFDALFAQHQQQAAAEAQEPAAGTTQH